MRESQLHVVNLASGGHVQVLSDRLCKFVANTKRAIVLCIRGLTWLSVRLSVVPPLMVVVIIDA